MGYGANATIVTLSDTAATTWKVSGSLTCYPGTSGYGYGGQITAVSSSGTRVVKQVVVLGSSGVSGFAFEASINIATSGDTIVVAKRRIMPRFAFSN